MKLADLKEVSDLSERRTAVRELSHRVSVFPSQLAATYLYNEAEGRYSIDDIVGGDWLSKAVVARCDELEIVYNDMLRTRGVEVSDDAY